MQWGSFLKPSAMLSMNKKNIVAFQLVGYSAWTGEAASSPDSYRDCLLYKMVC